MNVLSIDPGPEQSGVVFFSMGKVIESEIMDNVALLKRLLSLDFPAVPNLCAVEMIASYGMPVGKEIFETCVFIGEIKAAVAGWTRFERVYRKDVKIHLCQSMKAKDPHIRQALIDKHGVVGTKKSPGPLFGISGHLWAALAVADYANDTIDPRRLA